MPADPSAIRLYHAHVYYQPGSRDHAAWLREEIGRRFAVALGRWHDALVGPHTRSMYQVAFAPEVLAELLPWLMLNRGPLDILALIDRLNGVIALPEWSTDIDRDGSAGPQDILRLIDLLNGAGAFEPWNGKSLP